MFLEVCEVTVSSSSVDQKKLKHFARADKIHQKPAVGKTPLLTPGKAWEMRVDFGRQLVFLPEIMRTSPRPVCVIIRINTQI